MPISPGTTAEIPTRPLEPSPYGKALGPPPHPRAKLPAFEQNGKWWAIEQTPLGLMFLEVASE